jgi:hypothetical protein
LRDGIDHYEGGGSGGMSVGESLDEQAAEGVSDENVRRSELRGFKSCGKFSNHVGDGAGRERASAPAQSGAIIANGAGEFGGQRLDERPTQAASGDTRFKDNDRLRAIALGIEMQLWAIGKLKTQPGRWIAAGHCDSVRDHGLAG